MSEITVQETRDYDKFQRLIANRDLSRKHINALKNAIQKKPQILQAQPILVNEHMFIIDGQHRFQAAVELNLPVCYTVVSGIGIETARAMNILQRRWGPMDFAKSYALTSNKNYKEYLQARQDYEPLKHTTVLMALAGFDGYSNNGDASRNFREGYFEIGDLAAGRKNLDRLLEIKDLVAPLTITTRFTWALLKSFGVPEFKYDRFVARLKVFPKTLLHGGSTSFEYLRLVEDIYNYDMGEKNRLRLF